MPPKLQPVTVWHIIADGATPFVSVEASNLKDVEELIGGKIEQYPILYHNFVEYVIVMNEDQDKSKLPLNHHAMNILPLFGQIFGDVVILAFNKVTGKRYDMGQEFGFNQFTKEVVSSRKD